MPTHNIQIKPQNRSQKISLQFLNFLLTPLWDRVRVTFSFAEVIAYYRKLVNTKFCDLVTVKVGRVLALQLTISDISIASIIVNDNLHAHRMDSIDRSITHVYEMYRNWISSMVVNPTSFASKPVRAHIRPNERNIKRNIPLFYVISCEMLNWFNQNWIICPGIRAVFLGHLQAAISTFIYISTKMKSYCYAWSSVRCDETKREQ